MMKIHQSINTLLSRVSRIKNCASKVSIYCYSNVTAEPAPGADMPGLGPPLMDPIGRRHNYLRISLTERCNLRCQYCMPAEGVPLSPRAALLTTEEVLRLARVFAALGVDKVRLTGGEPTLRKDLAAIIQGLNEIEGIQSVSMTTNGLVLTRRLPALQRAGLAAVNVSLDSLRADRYERMARRPGLSRVLAGIDLALQLGYRPVKINTVLMKGFNDDELLDFVEYTRDREIEVRFIEFMPFAGNEWDQGRMVPYRAALRTIFDKHPDLMPLAPRPNDTARVWQVPGHAGRVGFISSMTQNFCSTCNRLRLTADGNLKVCLLGGTEVSLREAVRAQPAVDDDHLARLVRRALSNKKPQHAARGHCEGSAGTPAFISTRGYFNTQAASTTRRLAARGYCTDVPRDHKEVRRNGKGARRDGNDSRRDGEDTSSVLTHLDAQGRARMVDVGNKPVTSRTAAAECSLHVGGRLLRLLRDANLPKGDALTVAQLAGVLAAKRTHELIPLCHALPLNLVQVYVTLPRGECAAGGAIKVRCEARAAARTGVEMEALTGAAVAALALYDMCKAVDRGMRISDLRVVHKEGGASSWPKETERPPPLRAVDDSPLRPAETYAPTDLMHF